MADLTDIQAAQSIKIIGSDNAGVENTPVCANANGRLQTSDISNGGGDQAALTVGTSAVEVRVGGSPLSNRTQATLYNNSSTTFYWGYTNSVTTSTGTPIEKKQTAVWSVGPNTSIYVIAGSGGNNARITESA